MSLAANARWRAGDRKKVILVAQHCADSAAILAGDDPVRFWQTPGYAKVLAGSLSYIEEVGIEEAKARFQRGELNFPAAVYQ